MGLEVASAYRYIDGQKDFGPFTKTVLKGIVRKVAEAAISDVEDFAAQSEPVPAESDHLRVLRRLQLMASGYFG